MSEERVPLEQVLPGMRIHSLEEGEIPVSAFMVIKVLDREGSPTWSFRTTEPIPHEELLGALVIQTELLKRTMLENWE